MTHCSDISPLISIVTVCFNAADTITYTLPSVQTQQFRDFEHLVIDGNSSDGTQNIVNQYIGSIPSLHLISEPDHGIYDAMNKGLALARGRYIMFLNAGDKLHSPDTLQLIADTIINSHPDIVYGQTDIVDYTGTKIADRHLIAPKKLSVNDFKRGMVVCHQAFIVNRDIAPQYDLHYRYSSDYDWCIRCLLHSKSNTYIDATLIDYLNEGITTANRRRSLKERYHIMCRHFGTIPTIIRHLGFIPRYLMRRITLGHNSE